ncbi:hypothetical protein BDZ45DRAFT_199492 [Acephala macrosclerotiorum]|nr:hypothetical protein BDZ45DRAFT_199492 [Acephala macrosclerotiorum]
MTTRERLIVLAGYPLGSSLLSLSCHSRRITSAYSAQHLLSPSITNINPSSITVIVILHKETFFQYGTTHQSLYRRNQHPYETIPYGSTGNITTSMMSATTFRIRDLPPELRIQIFYLIAINEANAGFPRPSFLENLAIVEGARA